MYFQINLLPPVKRKIVFNIYLLYYLKLLVEIFLIYSIIIAVTFILSSYFLNNSLKEFEQQIISLDQEYSGINKQITDINKKLKKADVVQTKMLQWNELLFKLFNLNRVGITLNGLEIQSQEKTIFISGKAQTRQNLLDYQMALKNLPFLKNIELPVSALIAKEDINFNLKAELNLP